MQNQPGSTHKTLSNTLSLLRRYWIAVAVFTIALLLVAANTPAWAAAPESRPNQTVPPPTPKPSATKAPKPTPSDTGGNNGGDNGNTNGDAAGDSGQPPQTNPGGVAAPSQQTGTVAVARLNARTGPGTTFNYIGTFTEGTRVTILYRNGAGDWWFVCCVPDTTTSGWVSAQFVRPDFALAQANTLIPVHPDLAATTPATESTPAPTPAPTAAALLLPTPTPKAAGQSTALTFVMSQSPALARQGDTVQFRFVVTNAGATPALNVTVRDELAKSLALVGGNTDGNSALTQETAASGNTVIAVTWPELAPGASATSIVTVTIASDLPDGALVDNLAVAYADNAESVTAGVAIGMPPALLPSFQ